MRIVKYIISVILIVVVSFFIVEGYAQYTGDFESAYIVVAVKPTDGTKSSIEAVSKAAEKNSVNLFTKKYRFNNKFSRDVNLYCTNGMEAVLQKESLIAKGNYKSLFLGNIRTNIYPITELPTNSKVKEYFVYGDTADIYRFSDDIEGECISDNIQARNTNNYTMLWIIVLLTTIMLTLYDVALLRKEVIIRLISGQNIKWFALKKGITDAGFYCMCFIISILVISTLSSSKYYLENSALWMILIIIGNAALYSMLRLTNYKKDIHTGLRAKRVLKISYLYKIITVVITLVVVSGCTGIIIEGTSFYKQNDVFSNNKNYSYYQINIDDIDHAEQLSQRLYKEYLKKKKTFTMVKINDMGTDDNQYIYADAGTLSYLKQQIPTIAEMDFKQQVYFIKPTDYKKSGNEGDESEEAFETYYDGSYQSEQIGYEGYVELLACDGSNELIGVGTSLLIKNPVIILNNKTEGDIGKVDPYILQSAMLNITDQEWKNFAAENSLNNEPIYKTNAYDNFYNQWIVKKNSTLLSIALIFMIFVIEVILINNILKYEFYVNAQQLTLKKIQGYRLLERYRRIFMVTFLCTIIGSGCASLISYFITPGMWPYMITAAAAIIIIETVLIILSIRKLESRNIQRILKGSIL